ncbi:MAG: septal ring lytic transglycosylase RlpA family protein [Sphingobacteriales bacterium]|nr:MAG: septal ring lytic transglycosylase RlpA family protein [Sphingobacteriales bacterium]
MKLYFLLFCFIISSAFTGFIPDDLENTGIASYYAQKFHGRRTSSGEIFDQNKLTAAHRTLPMGSRVKVTRLDNDKAVVVKINDRGPFVKNRIIDLSKAAAQKIDLTKIGMAKVKLEVIGKNGTGAGVSLTEENLKELFLIIDEEEW